MSLFQPFSLHPALLHLCGVGSLSPCGLHSSSGVAGSLAWVAHALSVSGSCDPVALRPVPPGPEAKESCTFPLRS